MTSAEQRRRMVDQQLRSRGVADDRVLDAMGRVPREEFVDPETIRGAYDDRPLPIGHGQTISQPFIVAIMAEAAAISAGDTVLEVGTGSGYGAAVLSLLAGRVVTVERHEALAQAARERLHRLGYDSVEVRVGDGTLGAPDAAPFDAIVVTAVAPEAPAPLLGQLAPGGTLVIPLERRYGHQQLMAITRVAPDAVEERALLGVAFVPLIGAHGYPESGRRRD